MRRTESLLRLAIALMRDPDGQHWGYELAKASGLRSGVLYPILHRLYDQGWLDDGWEELSASSRTRPPRRYYELTDLGRQELAALADTAPRAMAAPRSSPRPRWAT